MTTWPCSGCKKIWQAEKPPSECACRCRIICEVAVTPVEEKKKLPVAAAPAPAAPAVPAGPQPFWGRARK